MPIGLSLELSYNSNLRKHDIACYVMLCCGDSATIFSFSTTEEHGAHGVTKNPLCFLCFRLFKIRSDAETRFRVFGVFRGSDSWVTTLLLWFVLGFAVLLRRRSEVLATSATLRNGALVMGRALGRFRHRRFALPLLHRVPAGGRRRLPPLAPSLLD